MEADDVEVATDEELAVDEEGVVDEDAGAFDVAGGWLLHLALDVLLAEGLGRLRRLLLSSDISQRSFSMLDSIISGISGTDVMYSGRR